MIVLHQALMRSIQAKTAYLVCLSKFFCASEQQVSMSGTFEVHLLSMLQDARVKKELLMGCLCLCLILATILMFM